MALSITSCASCIQELSDDNRGTVSFKVVVNGDLFGSTHSGVIVAGGRVKVERELRIGGSGRYVSYFAGNHYVWTTQCPSFQGVHMLVSLTYAATVQRTESLDAAAKKMFEGGFDVAYVLDGVGDPIGVVYERDLYGFIGDPAGSVGGVNRSQAVESLMKSLPVP